MEYYQSIQNRTGQTAAVINANIPALAIGTNTATTLLADSAALTLLAQTRDDKLAAWDSANNAENLGFLAIRALTMSLPQAAEGDLNDDVPIESGLLDLLAPAYAVTPRTTEFALERGKKVVSALTKINTALPSLDPPRTEVTSGGLTVTDLVAAMDAQPDLEQAVEDAAADLTTARTALRGAATALDRLNKRFYSKLLSEARTNPALATALNQIDTGSSNLPETLGISDILQGGAGGLSLLVSYENGTYDATAESTIEWMVVGVDADFTHNLVVDPSGNALGPFTVGQTVILRTRVVNTNGTTTGSVRTLMIQTP